MLQWPRKKPPLPRKAEKIREVIFRFSQNARLVRAFFMADVQVDEKFLMVSAYGIQELLFQNYRQCLSQHG